MDGEKIEFECDFCGGLIVGKRFRWCNQGKTSTSDACEKCFSQHKETIPVYRSFQPGEAEREDYESFFETTFHAIVDYGMHPFEIVDIPETFSSEEDQESDCDQDHDHSVHMPEASQETNILISNSNFDMDDLEEAEFAVDPTGLHLILSLFNVSSPQELVSKRFLTRELSAVDAAHALILASLSGGARSRSSLSEFTNHIAKCFAELKLPDLTCCAASDLTEYLQEIFQVTGDNVPTKGAAEKWLTSLATSVLAVAPDIKIEQFSEPFVGERAFDVDIRVKFTNDSACTLILQLAPEYRGWNCVLVSQ
jgi:hypothetical protein